MSKYPGEPLPLKFTWACSDRTWIDFDSYPFSTRVATGDPAAYNPPDTVDIVLHDCMPEEFDTSRVSHAGIIPKGKPVTRESCEANAFGGGLKNVVMGTTSTAAGITEGATMCLVTDKKRLMKALITGFVDSSVPTITFEVSTL